MTDTRTAPLRARGLSDLLDLIPTMIGFHPHDSLVVICLDAGRVAVTARVDLAPLVDAPAVRQALTPILERFPGADWVVVGFGPDAALAWRTLDTVTGVLGHDRVLECVHVDGVRWRRWPGDEGRPYDPSTSAVAAEAAFRGHRVLPDRGCLQDLVSPRLEPWVADAALARALQVPEDDLVASARRLCAAVRRRPRTLSVDEAAVLAVAACSPEYAESIILRISRDNADQAVALWTDVVRTCSGRMRAASAVILGLAAWVAGEGALLNVCLEVAGVLREWEWYRFLESVAAVALPPTQWNSIRAELRRPAA